MGAISKCTIPPWLGGHATYRTSPRPHRPKSRHILQAMSATGSPRVWCVAICRKKAGRGDPFEGHPRSANGGRGELTAFIEEVPKGHSLLLLLLGRCKSKRHTLALFGDEGGGMGVQAAAGGGGRLAQQQQQQQRGREHVWLRGRLTRAGTERV